jgi:hypothetical protein
MNKSELIDAMLLMQESQKQQQISFRVILGKCGTLKKW